MTWISLVGITLAVFALIATLAVRSGFRSEFVGIILGANAHVSVYQIPFNNELGQSNRKIYNYTKMAEALNQIPGVTRAAPIIKSQVMASNNGNRTGVQVIGVIEKDLATLPRISNPESSSGHITNFSN